VTPFDLGILAQKGSLYVTRPTLATYTATRVDLEATAREVFAVIRDGTVKVEIRHTYPLADAARVHRDLEGRRTVGSIVMTP
jgi:NADPH2:quinone reductase